MDHLKYFVGFGGWVGLLYSLQSALDLAPTDSYQPLRIAGAPLVGGCLAGGVACICEAYRYVLQSMSEPPAIFLFASFTVSFAIIQTCKWMAAFLTIRPAGFVADAVAEAAAAADRDGDSDSDEEPAEAEAVSDYESDSTDDANSDTDSNATIPLYEMQITPIPQARPAAPVDPDRLQI